MRSFTLLFVLLLILSANLLAQSPAKILNLAEKALGGKKNLQAVKSIQLKGNITNQQDRKSGAFLMQNVYPNLFNQMFDLDGFEIEIGYNGKSSWERDSRSGLQTLTGAESRDLSVEADFRNTLWLDYKKDKAKISAGGVADVNGKPAKIVILTHPKGTPIKMFFDAVSYLPVRQEFPSGETIKIFEYNDYRIVNKINVPYAMQLKEGNEVLEIKLDEVKINQSIPENEFDFPKVSNEPLPDIKELLSQLYTNADSKNKLLEEYSYNQSIIKRDFDAKGILREKESLLYQISIYKGFQVKRLVEKNGKPLNEKDQKKADEEAQKSIEEIDKNIAKKEKEKAKQKNNDEAEGSNFYSDVLKASNLINPRREKFRGRDVIVFDFEPNPKFDMRNASSVLKFFGKVAGVIWIDEKDREAVRVEAVLAENYKIGGGLVAKLSKGASFVLEQAHINNEVWLPSLMEINLSAKVLLFKGVSLNQIIKTSDYNKFKSEVKEIK